MKTPKLTLPAKHKSIAAAPYLRRGRETEYRIEGNPGLVLVVQAPTQAGRTTRTWRAYYSLTRDGQRTIRKVRLGTFPAIGLAEARRRAAEVIEAVERGRDPVADERVHRAASARDALTFTDLVEDHLADIAKRRGSKHVRDVRYAPIVDCIDDALDVYRPDVLGAHVPKLTQLETTSSSRRSTTSKPILPTASAATADMGRSQSMSATSPTPKSSTSGALSIIARLTNAPSWYSSCCYSRGSAQARCAAARSAS